MLIRELSRMRDKATTTSRLGAAAAELTADTEAGETRGDATLERRAFDLGGLRTADLDAGGRPCGTTSTR